MSLVCPEEDRVRRMVARFRAGGPDEMDESTVADAPDSETMRHAEGCVRCREVLEVFAWMSLMEMEPEGGAEPLPSAGRIWWKAQLASRHAAAERALRPVRVIESLSIAVGLVLAGAVLVRATPTLGSAVAAMSPWTLTLAGLSVFIGTFSLLRLLAR